MVRFSNYGEPVSFAGIDIVLELAATNARAHDRNASMGTAVRKYAEAISRDQINLVFYRE